MIESADVVADGNNNQRKRSCRIQQKWDTLAIFKDDKLVLMKFNNLASNQFDVYETSVPDKNLSYERKVKIENGDCIKKIEHGMCSKIIDASSNFNTLLKTVHHLKNENWALVSHKEKETPLQKYCRLKLETEELLEEIGYKKKHCNSLNEIQCVNIGFQAQNILAKLSKYSFNRFLEPIEVKSSEICNLQNYIANEHLSKLLYSTNINNITLPNLNIQAKLKPIKLQTDQLSRISQFENRLRKLEMVIGSEKLILKRLCCEYNVGVIESVLLLIKLSKQNLPQINANEPRIINILYKLHHITAISSYNNLKTNEKINELHSVILKAKEESHFLINIIQRMKMLEIFHHEVETLTATINNLNIQYSETSKTLENNDQLLNGIETHLVKEVTSMVSNVQSLNTQLKYCANYLRIGNFL